MLKKGKKNMASIKNKNCDFLLRYASEHVEVYNEVANFLDERFDIRSAELVLLVTYFVAEERRKHERI